MLGFFIAVQQSRISYKARQLELEADLFKISNEVIGLKDFKSSKYKNYQITQIASDGRVIYSSGFGSGALFANVVEDFMFASKGRFSPRKIKRRDSNTFSCGHPMNTMVKNRLFALIQFLKFPF